jgi:hypothetical protein
VNKIEQEKYVAWVGLTYSDIQIWGQYKRLVDFIFDEYPKSGRRFDEISLPTLFTLSHALELAFKENIKFFREYHGSKIFSKFESWENLIVSHDLKKLATEFKSGFIKLHKKVNAPNEEKMKFLSYFSQLEELIEILDRGTETYRYVNKIDSKGTVTKQSIKSGKKIDLLAVKNLFEKANELFIGAPNALGRYTDYIDYKKGNSQYVKGKGYLYIQKLPFSPEFLEVVKKKLDEQLTSLGSNLWMDSKSGENFEIQVWENDIYIISI